MEPDSLSWNLMMQSVDSDDDSDVEKNFVDLVQLLAPTNRPSTTPEHSPVLPGRGASLTGWRPQTKWERAA